MNERVEPLIKSGPPGEKQRLEAKRLGIPEDSPVPLAVKGSGIWIQDLDDNIFMDFVSSRCAVNIGHCHPRIMKVISETHLTHGMNPWRGQLAEELKRVVPVTSDDSVTSFALSGSAAVDASLKLARWGKKRPNIIAFAGAYHGVTFGAMAVSSYRHSMRKGFGPQVPGIYFFPYPNQWRSPYGGHMDNNNDEWVIGEIKHALETYLIPDEVAALIVEPVAGDAGWIFPKKRFFEQLRKITAEHDIALIMEEVQTGFGRTGSMFAYEQYNIKPDIVVLGKAMGGGLPMGGIVGTAELAVRQDGRFYHGHTFGGHPMGCRASIENIKIIEEENLLDNTEKQGKQLLNALKSLAQKHSEIILRAEGMGLLATLEFADVDKDKNLPRGDLADEFVKQCYRSGLYTLNMGYCGTACIRIAPPLIINGEQLSTATNILSDSLEYVENMK